MKSVKRDPYPIHNSPYKDSSHSENTDQLRLFEGLPFWIWDQKEHNKVYAKTQGKCCFNHVVGLPCKLNKEYPIFDYQELICNAIEQNQNIWILKSRGIGLTTFMIRYIAWKVLTSTELDNKSIFIISGTREQHANYIKEKLEELFIKNFPTVQFYSKYTELTLKNTWIKVFPTNNIKGVRGYFEASYIWVDESDHFEESVQTELLNVISPYEEKSNAKIILSSTPNKPNGLMQNIEVDKNSKYYKLKLPYQLGLDRIYDRAFIDKKKLDPEFEREYNLKYLGKIGNVFPPILIDQTVSRYTDLGLNKIPIVHEALHIVGIDPAFGSSNTAIVITEHLKSPDIVRVIYSREFEKANPQDIIDLCYDFHRKYYPNIRFIIDGSNAGFIRQMKVTFNEDPDYDYKDVSFDTMEIIPVNFSTDHKNMLSHLYMMVNKGYLAIPEKYDKLIISLRTAQANEYTLDKKQTSYDDTLDALRLSLKGYDIE